MDLSILDIHLHGFDGKKGTHVGHLFRYGAQQPNGVMRFVPLPAYAADDERPVLSLLFTDETAEETQRHLADIAAAEFNGRRQLNGPVDEKGLTPFLLPPWFQNLLPEGAFRTHIAELRGCAETDYFELLAACGTDLPGAVYAVPVKEVDQALMQRLVTQNHDALEASVVDIPLVEGISLSGIQPKLGVNKDAQGRYVSRTTLNETTHIIAKLPVVDHPLMPEVEHLSMQLARLAGVNACETELVPLEQLFARHGYDIGDPDLKVTHFLAVPRYDRTARERVHAEDFAQALGFLPHEKYTSEVPYATVMRYMLQFPSLGEAAVLELLRRLAVNELLGNPDCHLKNIGVYFPDGKTPQLPPAYDIVAHHLYNGARGHALYLLPPQTQQALEQRQHAKADKDFHQTHGRAPEEGEASPWKRLLLLSPATLKALAEAVGLPYKVFQRTADQVVQAAVKTWPAAIEAGALTARQRERMAAYLEEHPAVMGVRRRERQRG
ncbi:type II toxin-antitoxin system HipA family toxin [Hydrogenophaga sp.]|uniref:type II toxin-antitoxin system HipA family toxin n=1 Tax=Hydrogenophaga sp. TaxID=1904254 RepID=UPI002722051C|nr:type II toxin-antitoxin system HipA family toxin [Hydrogenophaga sp.]MDO9438867.1 type II toxin-antitoxin system HipA family toxin [Hydrogenophaga sp.]